MLTGKKLKKSEINIAELAAGQALTVPVYQLTPVEITGPGVYIQANVHGAEVQGNAVIFQLLKQLEKSNLNSVITLVPLANPMGINQKNGEFTLGRFDPVTGVNWNREYLDHDFDIEVWYLKHQHESDEVLIAGFRDKLIQNCKRRLENPWGISTGQRLATQLQKMAHEADIVIDLHTGPKSCKHLYCPEYAVNDAKFFSVPYTLVIPNDFAGAMDEAMFCPWWRLSEVANKCGRKLDVAIKAFTMELADQERIDLNDANFDANGIMAYLSHRNAVKDERVPHLMPRYGCMLKNYKKFHAPRGGMVEYLAALGQPLTAGEPLVSLLRMDKYGTKEELQYLSLPVAGVPILHFASAAVHQGTELYKVMTEVFELT